MYFIKSRVIPFLKMFTLPAFILSIIALGASIFILIDCFGYGDVNGIVFALVLVLVSGAIVGATGKAILKAYVNLVNSIRK